jgi:hypothetical protein
MIDEVKVTICCVVMNAISGNRRSGIVSQARPLPGTQERTAPDLDDVALSERSRSCACCLQMQASLVHPLSPRFRG